MENLKSGNWVSLWRELRFSQIGWVAGARVLPPDQNWICLEWTHFSTSDILVNIARYIWRELGLFWISQSCSLHFQLQHLFVRIAKRICQIFRYVFVKLSCRSLPPASRSSCSKLYFPPRLTGPHPTLKETSFSHDPVHNDWFPHSTTIDFDSTLSTTINFHTPQRLISTQPHPQRLIENVHTPPKLGRYWEISRLSGMD